MREASNATETDEVIDIEDETDEVGDIEDEDDEESVEFNLKFPLEPVYQNFYLYYLGAHAKI